LNIGEGSREEYEMLKDSDVVGKLVVESKY
jgi:hypothetical protein